MIFGRTSIPILQLRYQKAQTFAALLGIAFTTVLLFMQIGFRESFLNNLTGLPASMNAEIFIINASTVTVLRPPSFSQRRLYQVLAFDEVERVTPIYISTIEMRDPLGEPRYLRKIAAVGFPLAENPMDLSGLDENMEKLKRSKVFLIDEGSRPEFDPILNEIRNGDHRLIEIRLGSLQSRISIDGLFRLGANTSADSHLFTSDATFMEIFGRERSRINIGLVSLKDGANATEMVEEFRAYLPQDVLVYEKDELLAKERDFYEFSTPIGLIFRFGLGGAVLVGIVILYQILFQLISKYLRDYATLKAIGFSHGALRSIVLQEALMLAVAGYLPGFVASLVMYDYLSTSTSLAFVMTPLVAFSVLAAISFICLISALFAIRRLRDADPADLFG